MSEVTTLKQLMLDAARYRWVRENVYQFLDRVDSFTFVAKPSDCDEYIDEILDSE